MPLQPRRGKTFGIGIPTVSCKSGTRGLHGGAGLLDYFTFNRSLTHTYATSCSRTAPPGAANYLCPAHPHGAGPGGFARAASGRTRSACCSVRHRLFMRFIGSRRDPEPAMDRRNTSAPVFRSGRSRRIPAADAFGCCFLVLVFVRGIGGWHSLEDAKLGDSGWCGDVCLVGANRTARPSCVGERALLDCTFYRDVWSRGRSFFPWQPSTQACGGTGISHPTHGPVGC